MPQDLDGILRSGLMPGTLGGLLAGLLAGLLLLRGAHTARWARVWLWTLTLAYLVMSLPAGMCGIERLVSLGFHPIEDARTLDGAQAIVVLDGGTVRYERDGVVAAAPLRASATRALEAARLYRMMDAPLVVVTAGSYGAVRGVPEGAALMRVLSDAGVPAGRMVLDQDSRSTNDHARTVPALLASRAIDRWVLVTSAVHMRRALGTFRARGHSPIPGPTAVCRVSLVPIPLPQALERSYEAIYELFGLVYYTLLGRLG
jgi:uncharacterized SAM-binding protein YcdF (DUF218 family)